MTTKEAIIFESLKLFSVKGFDAVSTRMIARAVHASDAVIYKHFKNKKEILTTIIEECKRRYFSKRNQVDIETMCWKDVEKICMDMYRFQITDEWIVMFRRLLIIEQYNNQELGDLYRKFFIDAPVESMTEMFRQLIAYGYMKQGNPKMYAMELYAPFFMHHTISVPSEQLLQDLEDHVAFFRESVMTEKCLLDGKETGI